MEKLSEIIKIPEIKLVVQLSDADSTPDDIINSFVFTDEVLENINLILSKIENNQGSGIFIKGNFGSGKSHFLSYIYLLLKNKNSLNSEIIKKYPKILENDINIVKVSLVKYPSNNSLEKILLSLFQSEGEIFDRDKYYKELFNKKTAIIIDELSEFLRSKPNPQAFYEDIRFLQYLGEFSFENPLWIIATLQEWIEETGHISSSIFNRIKDRYPIRITLTSSHIEDIIDKRVVIKIPEKEEAIKKSFEEINKYFPKLQ
ncbi:MAG TPA: DUF6079 family protein, partial [Spirochaetota bacterium]|nr:DUF6079 family protein [Spirochaetota bacterium]